MPYRIDPLTVFDVPAQGGGQMVAVNGVDLFVDTVNGKDGGKGISWDTSLQTIEEALDRLNSPRWYHLRGGRKGSNSRIYVIGDVREQAVEAPVGVYGVQIIGGAFGQPHHSTSGGVVQDGNSVSWRQLASVAGAPLLKLREQGWGLHNICMIPESGYSAVQLRCVENAADPDASHFTAHNVFFVSPGTRVGYALEDVGGMNHIQVLGCEIRLMEFGWKQTSVGIRSPQWHRWYDNIFTGNKNDVAMNALACEFRRNIHRTVYDGTTHPITLNLAYTADAGVAATPNVVADCEFADNTADITVAKGYKPATGDNWRFRCANVAADVVTEPT